MRIIIIKSDEKSKFLRLDAFSKAIEYEKFLMRGRKPGVRNGYVWVINRSHVSHLIGVHHTKAAVIVNVRVLDT